MENFNMEAMMDMVKNISQNMGASKEKLTEKLKNLKAEGTAGGGVVRVVINGTYQLESIYIDDNIINLDDKIILQESIISAFFNANQKIKEKIKETVKNETGGLNLPEGLF